MKKVNFIVLFSVLASLSIVFSLLLWPSLWVMYVWECEPYTITLETVDDTGQTTCSVYHGTTCSYVMYWYADGGGGGGGGGDTGGGGTDEPQIPGGGGGQTSNPNDTDNNGYVDCWKNVMITLEGIEATGWGELRTRPDGTTYIHDGLDFSKPKTNIFGLDIHSVSNGTVTSVAPNANAAGGWWVSVTSDDGSVWTYCHMQNATTLAIGSRVYAGSTVLGQIDTTGTATGPHLHLSYKVNGQVLNPLVKIESGDC